MVPALFAERLTVFSLNSVLGNLHDIDRSKHHSVDAMSRDDLKELNKDKIVEEACREVSSEESGKEPRRQTSAQTSPPTRPRVSAASAPPARFSRQQCL